MGVDPGLSDTGWGVIHYDNKRLKYIAHGCVSTSSALHLADRVCLIHTFFAELIQQHKPTHSGCEDLFFSKNVTSAMAVAHARGVVLLALAQVRIPIITITPNVIKQAVTGNGNANKDTVQMMVKVLLGLPVLPTPNHAADALACAISVAYGAGMPTNLVPHQATS
jgi:crossover junction endodeoxyribonuclease RuvC